MKRDWEMMASRLKMIIGEKQSGFCCLYVAAVMVEHANLKQRFESNKKMLISTWAGKNVVLYELIV